MFAYDNEDEAATVRRSVAEYRKQHLIDVEDAAFVVKDANGKVEVRSTLKSMVKRGNVAAGGCWGLSIGMVVGGHAHWTLLLAVMTALPVVCVRKNPVASTAATVSSSEATDAPTLDGACGGYGPSRPERPPLLVQQHGSGRSHVSSSVRGRRSRRV